MNDAEKPHTGECHGGPLDGDRYTARGLSFRLDGMTMPMNPVRSRVQQNGPPAASMVSLRRARYAWNILRQRWEWTGWENV